MKSYDKAAWHIDGGEDVKDVISRFKQIFEFLDEKKMLTDDGKETYEYCMDSSVSLNSSMVDGSGNAFLEFYYDEIIKQNPKDIKEFLRNAYKKYMEK